MTLIITAIAILVIPGMLYNNLSNNGLIVSQSQSLTCSTDPQTPTCQISGNVGCQTNSSYCNLSGSKLSFLNSCSPFTNILTFNYVGFISSFFSNCGNNTIQRQGNGNQSTLAFFNGNETIAGLVPVFGDHDVSIGSGQSQWTSTGIGNVHPIRNGLTSPFVLTCLGWQQTNYHLWSMSAYRTGTELAQCTFLDGGTAPNQVALSLNCQLFGNSTDVNNAICTNFAPGSNVYSDTGGSAISMGSILGFALSLIGGTLIIILALGIDVSAFTLTLGENRQGTKMAQVFGVGLLIWGPLLSEFSFWYSTGLLPYGLDGTVGVVGVVLIATYFVGLYMWATQD